MDTKINETNCFDCNVLVDQQAVIFVRRQVGSGWGNVVMCEECYAAFNPGREPFRANMSDSEKRKGE